jgi:acetyltransferase-like isoleucine patch superfamily enzyme
MPGVTLAEGSILGANSLLTKDTEPWTIYVGIPAKPVKIRNKEKIIKYAKILKCQD